ncbi:MAG: hypothetical protein Tsb002_30950 [Wenzhouxiangellaceae bacterium]
MPASLATADDEDHGLKYRQIGPATGGRTTQVVGVPGEPLLYYLATAAGGVWKSTDGGHQWQPIFDDQPVSSVGSIAVADSDHHVVFVGSGEANIRGNVGEGNGIYRSTDGGSHWDHVWQAEGQIGAIAIHPADPNVIVAAVLGSPFGPGPQRGVYRSVDGGDNWQRVLYVDEATGAADVTFNPDNPRIVYASLWQTRRQPWGMTSGGPGSGLYRSTDGGATWSELQGDGLPDGIWGRVGVRVAPSQPQRVYALIEAEDGGLFRSDNGGDQWQRVNDSAGLRQRAWYYTSLTVDPTDADTVWMPNVRLYKTLDGGASVRSVKGGGWDYHHVWIDPQNPRRMAIASDAGVSLSRDGGETWVRPPLPLGQFYHITTDTRRPYTVLGSLQDLGTRAAPSNSLHDGGILLTEWRSVGGGEAGHVAARPDDPAIIYAGEYLGYLSRFDRRTGRAPHVGIYPDNGSGHGAVDLQHRFQWTAPILISPHNPQRVYHASQTLQRSDDGGQSWQVISPDLTRDDEDKQAWSGGPITGDNTGVEFYGTIFALAESPLEAGLIWTGSDDGLVHISRDDGENWDEVTPPDAPEWGTVAAIEASRWDPASAYLVIDAHRLDDETPYLWKTENYGRSWKRLGAELDAENYLHVVREDHQQQGVLYLGSERGVLVSRDDGRNWTSARFNMPTVAIADLALTEHDLIVGTLGRSAWIFDDLTPLRHDPETLDQQKLTLFKPVDTIHWHYADEPGSYAGGYGAGENPAEGALLTYYLSAAIEDELTLEIRDGQGNLVRRLSSQAEPLALTPDHPDWDPGTESKVALSKLIGFNRAVWDLRHEGAQRIAGATNDAGDVTTGPEVLPGEYLLRLIAGEHRVEQRLTVLADPRVTERAADRQQQLTYMLGLRDRLTELATTVTTLRDLEDQLSRRLEQMQDHSGLAQLKQSSRELQDELKQLSQRLYNPSAQVNYDILAGREGGAKLYSRYGWLYNTALEHTGPPTQGMTIVRQTLDAEFDQVREALQQLLDDDLPELNQMASDAGLGYVTIMVATD